MSDERKLPSEKASGTEVEDFLRKVALTPSTGSGERGRLIFAMDATASRQPTWDRASHIQAEMFQETAALGGLEIQLVFYRGFRECRASPWITDSADLLRRMTGVTCMAGHTQIARILKHALKEAKTQKVNALVFVGDCLEEDLDKLGHLAGELGLLGVPCFMFHEGGDPIAANAFRQVARLSGGAFAPFDANAPQQLRDLLSAVAVFAAGGRRALADYSSKRGDVVRQLTHPVR